MKVHQIVPYLGSGEPISSQALAIDEVLRSWGIASQVYAYNMDDFGRRHAVYDSEYRKVMHEGDGDVLIYHYALFCENYQLFTASRHRKVLVYHNITPEDFYAGYHFESYFLCRLGRQYLREPICIIESIWITPHIGRTLGTKPQKTYDIFSESVSSLNGRFELPARISCLSDLEFDPIPQVVFWMVHAKINEFRGSSGLPVGL